jgi:hypothetical protein
MTKHFYLLLTGVVLLGGCGKDKEAPPTWAGRFQAGSAISATDIMLYTSAGRVDTKPLVDKFLARRKDLATYFSRVDVPIPAAYSLTLAFRGNNRVTVLSKSPTGTDSILTEITSQSPQRLVLANMDSVNIPRSAPQGRAAQLSSLMEGEQPGQRCLSLPYVSGTYSQYCRVRPIRVITSRDGKLFLPQLSWLVQTAGAYWGFYSAYSGVQNTFNTAVISQLAAGDTLVVQAREVPLIKQ